MIRSRKPVTLFCVEKGLSGNTKKVTGMESYGRGGGAGGDDDDDDHPYTGNKTETEGPKAKDQPVMKEGRFEVRIL
jgi:hypothetical protein